MNLLARFLTVEEVLPKMVEANHGHVLATASKASFMTCAQNMSYSAAKAGLMAFHEVLRQELDDLHNARNVRTR